MLCGCFSVSRARLTDQNRPPFPPLLTYHFPTRSIRARSHWVMHASQCDTQCDTVAFVNYSLQSASHRVFILPNSHQPYRQSKYENNVCVCRHYGVLKPPVPYPSISPTRAIVVWPQSCDSIIMSAQSPKAVQPAAEDEASKPQPAVGNRTTPVASPSQPDQTGTDQHRPSIYGLIEPEVCSCFILRLLVCGKLKKRRG